MSIYGYLRRAYVLQRLATLFEGFIDPRATRSVPEFQRLQNTRTISHWLDQLRRSSKLDITKTLLRQMKSSQHRGQELRFNAQTVLLELLVESNLALDLTTYSAFICAEEARQEGS